MKGWNNEKIKEQLQLHKKQNKDERYNYLCREFNSLYYCWELEKYTLNLKKQLEAYENMRKELINIIEYTNFIEVETLEKFKSYFDNLMNILNKVGGNDE
jgi:hypothetical protein